MNGGFLSEECAEKTKEVRNDNGNSMENEFPKQEATRRRE